MTFHGIADSNVLEMWCCVVDECTNAVEMIEMPIWKPSIVTLEQINDTVKLKSKVMMMKITVILEKFSSKLNENDVCGTYQFR